jgi:hypothetical protein
MTLKIDRQHACKLSMACLAVAQMHEREAADPETTDDRRAVCKSSAEMWYAIREEVRAQIDEWDAKHPPKV